MKYCQRLGEYALLQILSALNSNAVSINAQGNVQLNPQDQQDGPINVNESIIGDVDIFVSEDGSLDIDYTTYEELLEELVTQNFTVIGLIQNWINGEAQPDSRINDEFVVFLFEKIEEDAGNSSSCNSDEEWESLEGICTDANGNYYDGYYVIAGAQNGGHISLEHCQADCMAIDRCAGVNYSENEDKCALKLSNEQEALSSSESQQNTDNNQNFNGIGPIAGAESSGDWLIAILQPGEWNQPSDWVCLINPLFDCENSESSGYCDDFKQMMISILEQNQWTWQQMLDNSAFSQSEDTFRAGAKAWSSCYPNWNDDADLNGDGVVDVEDVKLI